MEDSQYFSINYPEFGGNVGTIWGKLQQEKDFCDITLACIGKYFVTTEKILKPLWLQRKLEKIFKN